jgi:hypothetical protein
MHTPAQQSRHDKPTLMGLTPGLMQQPFPGMQS